jgi:hypothetical protein
MNIPTVPGSPNPLGPVPAPTRPLGVGQGRKLGSTEPEPRTHDLRTIRLQLRWKRPPLTLNAREHWRVKANKTVAIRETVRLLARADGLMLAEPIADPVGVELHRESAPS